MENSGETKKNKQEKTTSNKVLGRWQLTTTLQYSIRAQKKGPASKTLIVTVSAVKVTI